MERFGPGGGSRGILFISPLGVVFIGLVSHTEKPGKGGMLSKFSLSLYLAVLHGAELPF